MRNGRSRHSLDRVPATSSQMQPFVAPSKSLQHKRRTRTRAKGGQPNSPQARKSIDLVDGATQVRDDALCLGESGARASPILCVLPDDSASGCCHERHLQLLGPRGLRCFRRGAHSEELPSKLELKLYPSFKPLHPHFFDSQPGGTRSRKRHTHATYQSIWTSVLPFLH